MHDREQYIHEILEILPKNNPKDQVNNIVILARECESKFHQKAFDLLLEITRSNKYIIQNRTLTIEKIRDIFNRHRLKNLKLEDQINQIFLKLLDVQLADVKPADIEDFNKFRISIIDCLCNTGISEDNVFTKFQYLFESNTHPRVRERLVHALYAINPHKSINVYFKYIIDDKNERIRRTIHNNLRRSLDSDYDWTEIEHHFTSDYIEKVLSANDIDIREDFVILIGNHGFPNELYEKYFEKIIFNKKEKLSIRKQATVLLGNIGLRRSIVLLATLSETNTALKKEAIDGLEILSERFNVNREKLVEGIVTQPTNRNVWMKYVSIIFGFISLGMNFVQIVIPNQLTIRQIRGISIGSGISALITFAFILLIMIPVIINWIFVKNIQKEVEEKIRS